MNDRYLFRAKHSLESKKWHIGNLVEEPDGLYLRDNKNDIMVYIQDPSTICQCTGLKDKNGKLIWENDVVKHDFGKDQLGVQLAIVKYDSKYACYQIKPIYDWMYCDKSDGEVIGNIFDNPELIHE